MSWLSPKGVLIFSVHGRFVLHRANSECSLYGLEENWEKLIESYEDTGFGYADYPLRHGYGVGYGISLSNSGWWINLIESRKAMKLALLSERAWDKHHDVITVQNSNWD